ncbi:hypothetical protein TKK_0004958 [Trichogramma kaykai]
MHSQFRYPVERNFCEEAQNNVVDCHQTSLKEISSIESNCEEPQRGNDSYPENNIIDCHQTSHGGSLSTESNCEGLQNENDDNEADHKMQGSNLEPNPSSQTNNSTAHQETPRIPCSQCGKTLKNRTQWRLHLKRYHTNYFYAMFN